MISNPDNTRLERLWLQQLQMEFVEICRTYNLQLRPPIFEISDSRKELGGWHPETRTLRLSRHLIAGNCWSVTLQVLKHEMAHQLCSELFSLSGPPHGQAFQQACELLGVLPEYRRAGTELAGMVEQAADGSKLSIRGRQCLMRVEKLLALSRSSNEHEAALAMQKANELIEKYHIDALGQEGQYPYGIYIVKRKRKRIESYQRHICGILQDFFYVRVVLSHLYDPQCDDTFKTIELLGTKEHVAIAEYCYHFLENRLALLWSVNKQRFTGALRTEKNSYCLGLLRGFYEKLREQKGRKRGHPPNPGLGDLIVLEQKRLDAFVGLRFPRLRKVSRTGVRIYGSTYNEGVETGRTISFSQGLDNKAKGFGGLLPE